MKSKEQVINFIKEILKQAKENGFTVGKTQLIKLLYLLEIEYYRECRRRLTDLEWRFLHYGPYPHEIEEILGSPDIAKEQIDLSDNRVFQKFTVAEENYDKYCTKPGISRLILRIVKEWGGINLYKLLDYVYFETEPMHDAQRGDLLDFSKIKVWEETKLRKIKVDNKKLNKIRKNITEHVKQSERSTIRIKLDKTLSECTQIWDEGKTRVTIKGNVVIVPDKNTKD